MFVQLGIPLKKIAEGCRWELKARNSAVQLCAYVTFETPPLKNPAYATAWQPHIDKISEKLSKSCGMIFKLRPYVHAFYFVTNLLSHVWFYVSVFAAKLGKSISIPFAENQNFTKSFLTFQSILRERRCSLNVIYSEFGVLKSEDMLAMEYAKILHRFVHNMLLDYFKNYLDDLGTVHQHNTRQKEKKKNFFHTYARTEWGKKRLQCAALEVW